MSGFGFHLSGVRISKLQFVISMISEVNISFLEKRRFEHIRTSLLKGTNSSARLERKNCGLPCLLNHDVVVAVAAKVLSSKVRLFKAASLELEKSLELDFFSTGSLVESSEYIKNRFAQNLFSGFFFILSFHRFLFRVVV